MEYFIEQFTKELQYSSTPKKKHLVGYTLLKINDHIGDGTGELKVDPRMVNIEHILPQKPELWGFEPEEIESFVHNIGNLTLLSKKLNSVVGNKPMNKKLVELKKSELPITKHLVDVIDSQNGNWDEQKILNRGKDLAEISHREIWNEN